MSDVVALDLPGGEIWLDALRACWDRGDAVAPLPVGLSPAARQLVLDAVAPTHLIDADGVRHPAPRPGPPAESGDALVVATSGTTARPVGVVLGDDALDAAARATFAALGSTATDHWLACLPLHHIGGFSVVSRAVRAGLALTVLPGFDAGAVMSAAAGGATHTSLVPTALGRIDAGAFDLILLGGSAAPLHRPANTVMTYGMTESGGGVVYDGYPLDGVEVRTDERDVILLRSPTLARARRDGSPVVDADGWLHTGDVGSVDPVTGELTVRGRVDDVINTGGEKVWPAEVERILREHPDIGDVAVIGRTHPEWGEEVTAVVVPRRGGDPPVLDELRRACKEQLPAAWAPRRLELVEFLPTTSLGKVRRRELRESPGATFT